MEPTCKTSRILKVNLSCMALCPVPSHAADFSPYLVVFDEYICFLLAALLLVVLA